MGCGRGSSLSPRAGPLIRGLCESPAGSREVRLTSQDTLRGYLSNMERFNITTMRLTSHAKRSIEGRVLLKAVHRQHRTIYEPNPPATGKNFGHLSPGPYSSRHRCSKADTIIFETCPKNICEAPAYAALAKRNERSRVTKVGPWSCAGPLLDEAWPDGEGAALWTGVLRAVALLGCGERDAAGWNRHMVERLLKIGLEDEATACAFNQSCTTCKM